MADAARARKLATRIREIVADQLRTQVKDPRLGMVTITDVKITADLRDSTVFYTVLGNGVEKAATAVALESAKGVLRSEVGKQTGVRHTPSLTFILDALPDTSKSIEDLLAKAAAADAELHKQAQGAVYAGEPDPYRKPHDDDAEDDEDAADDEESEIGRG